MVLKIQRMLLYQALARLSIHIIRRCVATLIGYHSEKLFFKEALIINYVRLGRNN